MGSANCLAHSRALRPAGCLPAGYVRRSHASRSFAAPSVCRASRVFFSTRRLKPPIPVRSRYVRGANCAGGLFTGIGEFIRRSFSVPREARVFFSIRRLKPPIPVRSRYVRGGNVAGGRFYWDRRIYSP